MQRYAKDDHKEPYKSIQENIDVALITTIDGQATAADMCNISLLHHIATNDSFMIASITTRYYASSDGW